ncbi:MAG TPA: hypothetical protein VLI69_04695 [Gammaproteobacteria bacterium]|nr:hypothetical protein [Gammaproteobacteria bacterium]
MIKKRPSSKIKSSTIKGSIGRGEKIKRFSLEMPASLHAKLKIAAVKKDETMAEILLKILEEYLK